MSYNEGNLIVHGAASFISNSAKGYGGAIYNAKTTPAVKKVIKSLPVKTQLISSNTMN